MQRPQPGTRAPHSPAAQRGSRAWRHSRPALSLPKVSKRPRGAKAAPCVPRAALEGAQAAGGGRGVRPFKSQAWSLKGLPVPPPFSQARPPKRRRPSPSSVAPLTRGSCPNLLVSFFQFLRLPFPISLFLLLAELGKPTPHLLYRSLVSSSCISSQGARLNP